jgi:hypothetical protein
MPFIGTNMFLGNEFIGQTYLGEDRIEVSPYNYVTASLVTQNLLAYFDSSDTNSYPGSGTEWYNLVAGQPITASLVNGVTFKDGYLQTNGTNQYISIPTALLDSRTGNSTVMGATRYADTSGNGRMMSGQSGVNWLLGHFNDTTVNYYPGGTVVGVPGGPNDTNWRVYAGTANYSGDDYVLYVNGSAVSGTPTAGTTGPYGMEIGRQNNNTEYSSGSVAFVLFYARVLSAAEILQNYEFLKSKVGL